jgi:arsenite methyltransferase
MSQDDAAVRESVKEYYGKILSSTSSLKTSACVPSDRPHLIIRQALKRVPQAVKDKYYGCGSAVPLGIEGLDVLDLGSGSGQDCYVAAQLVGPTGSVIGVDMTEEQNRVAKENIASFAEELGYSPKLEFREGLIEDLQTVGIKDESLDMIIRLLTLVFVFLCF